MSNSEMAELRMLLIFAKMKQNEQLLLKPKTINSAVVGTLK